MISAVNNGPSFTSVIPVRVYVDGMQTFDEKLIKSACRKVGTVLTSAPKTDVERNMQKLFAVYDPHYLIGKFAGKKKFKPSEFSRTVMGKNRDVYMFTGPQAELLVKYGKEVGIERRCCKEHNIDKSLDLIVAKRNYSRIISNLLSSANLRIKDRVCKMLTLDINMNSNKKYGLSTFKTQLDKISFTS